MQALCNLAKNYGPLIGRILIALIFLKSGFEKITGFSAVAGFMAKVGMPAPEFLLVGSIVFEIAGGLMVLLGWHARWGALPVRPAVPQSEGVIVSHPAHAGPLHGDAGRAGESGHGGAYLGADGRAEAPDSR